MVQRGGNCSFLAKARNIQAAGYDAMILYDPMSDECTYMASDETQKEEKRDMTLLAASITATAAEILIDSIDSTITLTQPEQSAFDLSEVGLWLIAVGAVASGSIWAGKGGYPSVQQDGTGGAGHGQRSHNSRESEGIEVISVRAAASFIFVASAALVAMFFLLSKWLAFILTGLFSIIAWQALTVTSAAALYSLCPTTWSSYKLSTLKIRFLDCVSISLSTLLTVTWLVLVFFVNSHRSWILQDILCLSLVLLIFKTLQLPNLKVSTILLSSALIYDVWWVFLQPLVVGGPSVMVEVATGGGGNGFRLPIVFAIPRYTALGTNPSLVMLGLGDVVLPGLLVAMARRRDVAAGKEEEREQQAVLAASAANMDTTTAVSSPTGGPLASTSTNNASFARRSGFYFLPMVVAYASGLLLTFVALYYGWGGDQGQPALLYLTPSTLGMMFLLGGVRGELSGLWNWEEQGGDGDGLQRRRGRDDVEEGEGAPLLSHPVTFSTTP